MMQVDLNQLANLSDEQAWFVLGYLNAIIERDGYADDSDLRRSMLHIVESEATH